MRGDLREHREGSWCLGIPGYRDSILSLINSKQGANPPKRIQLKKGPKRNLSLKFPRSSIISLPSYTHSLTCSNFSLSSHSHPSTRPRRPDPGGGRTPHHVDAQTCSCAVSPLQRPLAVGRTRSHVGVLRPRVGVLRPRGRHAARLASSRECRAGRPAPPALMPRSLAPGGRLIHQL